MFFSSLVFNASNERVGFFCLFVEKQFYTNQTNINRNNSNNIQVKLSELNENDNSDMSNRKTLPSKVGGGELDVLF